jgi:pimeloyl-ACP methyl ester carboxylesterase
MRLQPVFGVFACLLLAACGSNGGRDTSADVQSGTVGDAALYYEMAGKGAPVILIHGGFGDRRMWDEQFLPLSQVFRVIRYDHRGFGKSPAPEKAYSPVADLVAIMDHLKLTRANLVGNSMGGTLALDFALLHPERTGAVVPIASAAGGYDFPEDSRESVTAVVNMARGVSTAAAAALWLQHPMVGVATRHPKSASLVSQMVLDNQRFFLMDHWPEEPMSPPAFERLGGLKANVLFIVGEKDVAPVRDGARASADRIKGAKLETIPGADHLPQMEEPERVNKLLVDYISLNGC